jgi:hypothetical protein
MRFPLTQEPVRYYPARQYPRRQYQESGMLLELGKFCSLLLGILCLCAVFHCAFLVQDTSLIDRLVAALKMLAGTAVICYGSGWIFHRWDLMVGIKDSSIVSSLPMKLFWWALLGMAVLFIVSWYLEYYYMPLRRSLSW